jgi:hypothetical protein
MIDQSAPGISRTSSVLLAVLAGAVLLGAAIALAVSVTPISWPFVVLVLLLGVGTKLVLNKLEWRLR